MSRFVSSLARTLDFGESTIHKPIRGLTSLRTLQGPQGMGPVSDTHLTLPTILLV
jgi:hypothetical protein